MTNGDEEGLENPVADRRGAWTGRRRRAVRVASVAGLALGLAAGGSAVAGATTSGSSGANSTSTGQPPTGGMPPNGGSPPAVVGTVATVGSNSFTVKAKDGSTVTVDVSSSTTYRDRDVTSPTLANVTVGEMVAAFGTETSNTVTATSVDIGGPGGPGGHGGPGGSPPAAVGTVATVGSNSFTIKTKDGTTVTVDVSSSTTYRDRDVTSPTLANVTVGEMVAAFGTETSNTVTATSVDIGGPGGPGGHGGPGGSPPAAVGTVATVGSNSFTIKTKDGTTVTVDVSSSTTYRDRDVTSPTLANVTVGEMVAAFGTETSNTVTATSVDIGGPGGAGPGGPGGRGPGGTGARPAE